MAQQTIKYGTESLIGNFSGKHFDDLPRVLEEAYELEVPSECEFVVDGEVVNGNDEIQDTDSTIEIRAVAGKKE